MRVCASLLPTVLLALTCSNSLACTYSDYLLTLENHEPRFKEFLAASNQGVGDLDRHIVDAAYPVCGKAEHFNFVHFYVADGSVRFVANSITFAVASDADEYYSKLFAYLSAEYNLQQSRTVQGESKVVRERHARFSGQAGGLTLNLAMVTEYDFGEYSVYLESYLGEENPLMQEAQ